MESGGCWTEREEEFYYYASPHSPDTRRSVREADTGKESHWRKTGKAEQYGDASPCFGQKKKKETMMSMMMTMTMTRSWSHPDLPLRHFPDGFVGGRAFSVVCEESWVEEYEAKKRKKDETQAPEEAKKKKKKVTGD